MSEQFPTSTAVPTAIIPTISGALVLAMDPPGRADAPDTMHVGRGRRLNSKHRRRRKSGDLRRAETLACTGELYNPIRVNSTSECQPCRVEGTNNSVPAPSLRVVAQTSLYPDVQSSFPLVDSVSNLSPSANERQHCPVSHWQGSIPSVNRLLPSINSTSVSSKLDSGFSDLNSFSIPVAKTGYPVGDPNLSPPTQGSFESVIPSTHSRISSRVSSSVSSRIQRMADRVNNNKNCRLFLWFMSVLCAANIVFFILAYDKVVEMVAVSQLALHESGAKYEAWTKTPMPVYYKVTIFNLTNHDEFMAGERPRLREIGPYVYRMMDEKVNVTFHDNGTVTYRTKPTYFFEPDLSGGTEDDKLYTVNIPLVNAADAVKDSPFLKTIIQYAGIIHNFETIRHLTVMELLWGHTSKVLDWGRQFQDVPYPHLKFGLLTGFNNSAQDSYTMYTGVNNPEKMNFIHSWNGRTKLNFWEGESCNRIFGTDAGGFSPGVKPSDELWIFNGQLCRSIPLVYQKTVNRGGINAFRFVPPRNVFSYGPKNPQNSCYCSQGRCPPTGVLDMKPCYYGAAIAFSFPHFYQADSTLRHMVRGLRPDPAKHSTEFDIFPDLGIPLRVKLRMQMNVVLDQNQALSRARHYDLIYPIFWFEAGIDSLPPSLVGKLQMAQDLPPLMKQIFVVVCGVLTVVFLVLLMAQTFVGWCSSGLSSLRSRRGKDSSSNDTITTSPESDPSLPAPDHPEIGFPPTGCYTSFASPQLSSSDVPDQLIDSHTLLPPYKTSARLSAPDSVEAVTSVGKRKLVGTNSVLVEGSVTPEPSEAHNLYPPEYSSVVALSSVERSDSSRSSNSSLHSAEVHQTAPLFAVTNISALNETGRVVSCQPDARHSRAHANLTTTTQVSRSQVPTMDPSSPSYTMEHKPILSVPRIVQESLKTSAPLASPEDPDDDHDGVRALCPHSGATEGDGQRGYGVAPSAPGRCSKISDPLATSSPHVTLEDIPKPCHDDGVAYRSPPPPGARHLGGVDSMAGQPLVSSPSGGAVSSRPQAPPHLAPPLESDL